MAGPQPSSTTSKAPNASSGSRLSGVRSRMAATGQAERKIGLDLPMKALAWEDDAGKVWLAYGAPADLKTRYQVSGQDKVFGKMTGVLGKLTDAAIKAE